MASKFKQTLWILLPIIFILIVFGTIVFSSLTGNETDIQSDAIIKDFSPPQLSILTGKEATRIGIYVVRVWGFDSSTGTYQIEFYLNFVCETAPCDPSDFEIPNAISDIEIEDQTDPSVRGKEYYYRVTATMQTTIDVRSFPFDVQKLRIEFEDKYKSRDSYIYVPDIELSDIEPQANIGGWSAAPAIIGYEEPHYYYTYDTTYSKAVFELLIYNSVWESILKTILPIIVITFAGIISFFMRYDRAGDRLGVVSSSLVSAVLFSLSFPKGATYMSAYMLANYLILVSALVVTVRLIALVNENKHDEALKLHDLTDNVYPVIWLIVQVLFIGYGLVNFNLLK